MIAFDTASMVPISEPKLLDLDQLATFVASGVLVLLFSIGDAIMEHGS